jgi:hypothetical protein
MTFINTNNAKWLLERLSKEEIKMLNFVKEIQSEFSF